jgi:hypothetical protein
MMRLRMRTRLKAGLIFLLTVAVVPAMAQQTVRVYDGEGLDTQGMIDSEVYQHLYYGQFDLLRARNGFEKNHFAYLFVDAATAYASVCRTFISVDSTAITVTATTVDGRGNHLSSSSRERVVDARFSAKVGEYGVAYQAGAAGKQLVALFQRNHCVTPEVVQFLENLLRFANRQPPLQDKPPEPVRRYATMGDADRARRTLSERQSRLDDALNYLIDLRTLDRSPSVLQELYRQRQKFHDEMPEIVPSLPSTLLSCSYIDPSGSTGSPAHYFWKDSLPPGVTDAYLRRLNPRNPLRHIGAPRKACPDKEPSPPHPADVLAKLVVVRAPAGVAARPDSPAPAPVAGPESAPVPVGGATRRRGN